jgi:endonuclease-3
VVLSARTRDDRLIKILPELYRRAPTPQALLKIPQKELEQILHPVGFYRAKARTARAFASELLGRFDGKLPRTKEELISLPGIGIKVAGILLIELYDQADISVDTHVHRITNRMGFVTTRMPEQTYRKLIEISPRRIWKEININLVSWGQTICKPIGPLCPECPVNQLCEKVGVR